ncbi:hypothetical protein A8F94_16395 [Bacillus sp. FJAT-27225]|uniref:hypothetical protein n=1 Tax=Bacillus sp. FJAT-27225 TaxID=1743144 RepID=UPI00080C33D8|nr:hypothetical protein [Bacillus sp. FJAT-27225]OCA84291.1 hypothetical protein A8F94_16395 [Bacillus sp. FJAT-27225]
MKPKTFLVVLVVSEKCGEAVGENGWPENEGLESKVEWFQRLFKRIMIVKSNRDEFIPVAFIRY